MQTLNVEVGGTYVCKLPLCYSCGYLAWKCLSSVDVERLSYGTMEIRHAPERPAVRCC